jgi:hypothetical protein
MGVTVTVRDGCDGRDTHEVGGQILMILRCAAPIEVGEQLELPDGSWGKVERTVQPLACPRGHPVRDGCRPVTTSRPPAGCTT